MKRQVAILGPTPEFLRWSVRQPCSLRQHTDLASVDQTEKRLRAIRAAGAARAAGEVVDGFAMRETDDGAWVGFCLADVFDVFGGESVVVSACQRCPANIVQDHRNGIVAGCCGWLVPDEPMEESHTQFETARSRLPSDLFLETTPVWYGVVAHQAFSGHYLAALREALAAVHSESENPPTRFLTEFKHIVTLCDERGLNLDIELVPPGDSDGITWTIAPHCDRCRAPYAPAQRYCPVCRKQGAGHPPIVRRALGLRPWGPLHRQVSGERLNGLIARYRDHARD